MSDSDFIYKDLFESMFLNTSIIAANEAKRRQWLNGLHNGRVNYAHGHEVIDGTVSPIPKEIET